MTGREDGRGDRASECSLVICGVGTTCLREPGDGFPRIREAAMVGPDLNLRSKPMKNTLSILVRNQVGVVAQTTEVFRVHNVNLNSISCAETEAFDVSRLMLTVEGQEHLFDAVKADLASKDFVLEVEDLSSRDLVDRELALVKVAVSRETTTQIMQVCEVFRATVVGMGQETMTLEITGDMRKVDGFIRLLRPFGIRSLARTGSVALTRGDD